MKENIIITGVAGLLGSRLADWVLNHQPNFAVVGIDDLSGGFIENIDQRVKFYQIDCASSDVRQIFEAHSPKYVFHFAAYAAEGLSPFIRKFNYQTNLVATANIVNECIRTGVQRLVFASSMAVYGIGNPPFDESDQPAPIDPYGIAKYACELDIQVAGEQHDLDWCLIRPHNVYGVKQNIWDPFRNVLGIWMYQYIKGEPLTIFGDGNQKRAFSFIDDCLSPIWEAATNSKASKQIVNIGSGVDYTIKRAAEVLMEVMGGGELVFFEDRHEVKIAQPTCQKSIELLGFKDRTNLFDGLTIMWNWAKIQPERKRLASPVYELDKAIYEFWRIDD